MAQAVFTQVGKVHAAKIISSTNPPHNCHCFGFVVMSTADEAAAAVRRYPTTTINGATVKVELVSVSGGEG